MQNPARVPRGALLVISGLAAVAFTYWSYNKITQPQRKPVEAGLHRSNAMRRHRRRWRDGATPQELDYDPTTRAIRNLQRREEEQIGYGIYTNRYYVTSDLLSTLGTHPFRLLPSRLSAIQELLLASGVIEQNWARSLLYHLQGCFIRNFLETEYPESYLVAPDHRELSAALRPYIEPAVVQEMLSMWDHGQGHVTDHVKFDRVLEGHADDGEGSTSLENESPGQIVAALTGDPRLGEGSTRDENEDHSVLDVLYRIGEEQAKRSGYRHRGVECNWCGMQPILGIRYHCANCWDYDLCESCESQQFHPQTHVFYKIRIPAPTRGQIKLVQPKWYPGNPNGCLDSVPVTLRDEIMSKTSLTRQGLDALYDQFKCIASHKTSNQNGHVGMAISRSDFERYFTTSTADRPPKPNALLDRIFHFYDIDKDGLISFTEFATGMSNLAHDTTREARVDRMFKAFDLDSDGYVERRDFLHLLKAHYDLNKELAHEMIYARDEAILGDEEMLAVIHGTNPISAAFGGHHFPQSASRHGLGKHADANGDMVLDDPNLNVLAEDSSLSGNRAEAIARQASETRAAVRARAGPPMSERDEPLIGSYGSMLLPRPIRSLVSDPDTIDVDMPDADDTTWHNDDILEEDVVQALGSALPIADVTEPGDRQKVLEAQERRLWAALQAQNQDTESAAVLDRWRRRQFYRDAEEGLSKPIGYYESDSSDDENLGRSNGSALPSKKRQDSIRSGSFSRVRFDIHDNHNEGKRDSTSQSDASSKHIPLNERWGGIEMPAPPRNIGVDMIYEAVQEAFNDVLDHFFREREDLALEAKSSRKIRLPYYYLLERYRKRKAEEKARLLDEASRTALAVSPADATTNGELYSPVHSGKSKDEDFIKDPTLPQFRPDKISDAQLESWDRHELLEEADRQRGGPGRLNFVEFKRKLRESDTNDIDIGAEGQDAQDNYWEEKADLGKFSFLSTWIEMASF